MEIRRIRSSDLPGLARLNSRMFGDVTYAQAQKAFSHMLANSVKGACLLAEAKGEPVGAVFATKKITFSPDAASIDSFFVDKKWQGRGIGRKLFSRCLSALSRAKRKSISLTVAPGNARAKSIYRKAGFKPFRLMMLKVDG